MITWRKALPFRDDLIHACAGTPPELSEYQLHSGTAEPITSAAGLHFMVSACDTGINRAAALFARIALHRRFVDRTRPPRVLHPK